MTTATIPPLSLDAVEAIDCLVRREVVPAAGCTEPVCVALATAYASELLSSPVAKVDVWLSRNMLKNAMGVGIPGTGMVGLPIAIALGAVLAAPIRELELLCSLDPEQLAQAKQLVSRGIIQVHLKEGEGIDKLYVEAVVEDEGGEVARCIISECHTQVVLLELNGKVLQERSACREEEQECSSSADIALTFDLVYCYVTEVELERLSFIYEAAQQNKQVGAHSLETGYGHHVGQVMRGALGKQFLGDTPLTDMLSYTSGACDARMDGAPMVVMSNSGSGNQGIASTIPTLVFAQSQGASVEQTTRALMLSSLVVIYIKQSLGRLSALCGMVVAGIGTAAAMVYLMRGSKEQVGYAVRNMVGNVAGIICDGAKPGCSLKAVSGISSALVAALLAMEHRAVTAEEGIVAEDVDACIRNLVSVTCDGMQKTDQIILDVMTSKKQACSSAACSE